ncbi:SHOCT domain-containing protein [Clostridium sp. WILCCON 0269]|uniref:SHOCT domain-containing protein n=1 Tax=Candidatus Clostridium eludens TaxID=3381663 RepID=A0ABW8SMR4_9CLOT
MKRKKFIIICIVLLVITIPSIGIGTAIKLSIINKTYDAKRKTFPETKYIYDPNTNNDSNSNLPGWAPIERSSELKDNPEGWKLTKKETIMSNNYDQVAKEKEAARQRVLKIARNLVIVVSILFAIILILTVLKEKFREGDLMNGKQKKFIAVCLILYAIILSSIILNTNSRLSALNQAYDSKKTSHYYDSDQIEADKTSAKSEVAKNAKTTGIIISILFGIIMLSGKIILYNPNTPSNNTTAQKLNKLKQLKSQGILTDEEYESKRKDIIDNIEL